MMRILIILCFLLIIMMVFSAHGRDSHSGGNRTAAGSISKSQLSRGLEISTDAYLPKSYAQADTFILGYWDFEGPGYGDPQGWTSHDRTLQEGCFWHIDDFNGLNGGEYGNLTVLEGSQSIWCGLRPDSTDINRCRYRGLPGYGNNWDQSLLFKCIEVPDTEMIIIDYLAAWDTEPDYDYFHVEYYSSSTCDSLTSLDIIPVDGWTEIRKSDDLVSRASYSDTIPSGHDRAVKIRFRFTSDPAWSDEDGLWNSDGGVILDSITVRTDNLGIIDFEDFEDETLFDTETTDGDWNCSTLSGYGDYAGLFPGTALLQEDACSFNYSYVWAFINGSTETYACGSHPEQISVPRGNSRDQYIHNEIWSPVIPLTGNEKYINFKYDVYKDLPIEYLVFHNWHIRIIEDGCPQFWRNYSNLPWWTQTVSSVFVRTTKTNWNENTYDLSRLIAPGAEAIQLSLACIDMCGVWCSVYGDGDCHSHAPLFDNILVSGISITGPEWQFDDYKLFMDTFPANGTAIGTGRIDIGYDLAYTHSPNVYLGDSAVVTCWDNSGLISPEPITGFGSAVYFYLSTHPHNQPGKMLPEEIVEDSFRWPVVDSLLIDGVRWYQFRCDSTFLIERRYPSPDLWCIDINDNVFTNGDTLEYFFGAKSILGETNYWSKHAGVTSDINIAASKPIEIQILPGAGYERGGDILYVNYFNDHGAQPYFYSTFELLGLENIIDRFDCRDSYSGNETVGFAHQIRSVTSQLIPIYRSIIWNSGALPDQTVRIGAHGSGKPNDFEVLYEFLEQHISPQGSGIYFSGDNLAEEWADMGDSFAQLFRDTYMPHLLVSGAHHTNHGFSPICVGTDNGIFDHDDPNQEDSMVVIGACSGLNSFDQIQPLANSSLEMTYSGTGLAADGAVVAYDTINALGNPARVVLSGFSFHYIRDDRIAGIPDRADHLSDIINFLGNQTTPTEIQDRPAIKNRLAQNYPNPFNPTTTIRYSIKERAMVTLKIYNVAGQLIRTLISEEQAPRQEGYSAQWNGRNNSGQLVSSGVYFCRLRAGDFVKTKKMVLMK